MDKHLLRAIEIIEKAIADSTEENIKHDLTNALAHLEIIKLEVRH